MRRTSNFEHGRSILTDEPGVEKTLQIMPHITVLYFCRTVGKQRSGSTLAEAIFMCSSSVIILHGWNKENEVNDSGCRGLRLLR